MKYSKYQNLKDFMHKKKSQEAAAIIILVPYLLFPNSKIPCCYPAPLNSVLPFSFLLNMQLGSNLLSNQHKHIAPEEKKGYLTSKPGWKPAKRPKGTSVKCLCFLNKLEIDKRNSRDRLSQQWFRGIPMQVSHCPCMLLLRHVDRINEK